MVKAASEANNSSNLSVNSPLDIANFIGRPSVNECALLRMTTSRRIFSSLHMSIAQSSFRDVYNAIMTERDLSEPSMRELY